MQMIVITGPTGVGKTKLSIALAKKLNGEIINCDSMQFYKELDIGTAKIKEEEKEGVRHHLFDICDVEDDYTIYQYQKDARRVIDEIIARGHTPIMVGGTGLYIKAALYDYSFQEEKIKDDCSNYSNGELLEKILQYDPTYKEHVNNRKRLIRSYNKIQNGTYHPVKSKPIYPFICIGLTTDRKILYDKINNRVDKMIKEGLIEEVRPFYEKKIYSKALTTGIGYKELYSYFDGTLSKEEAIELIKKNSRHYAKRQYTFFHHQMDVVWIKTNYECFDETIEEALQVVRGNLC